MRVCGGSPMGVDGVRCVKVQDDGLNLFINKTSCTSHSLWECQDENDTPGEFLRCHCRKRIHLYSLEEQ